MEIIMMEKLQKTLLLTTELQEKDKKRTYEK